MTRSGATGFVPFEREEIEQSIPSRFEQQVRRYPDRLAVKTTGHTWTFEALNREANRVAHAILARDGHGRTPVALLIGQSGPMIAALLGILKAGKILVPLDPAHPPARLAQFIDDTRPTSVITTATHYDTATKLVERASGIIDLDALPPVLSDANPGIPSAPHDLAMILYTSGSTGRPKGVLTDHRIWIHNTRTYTNAFRICPDDRLNLLAFATAQAVKNLLLAILNGASIFPCNVKQEGLDSLAALMRREAISITQMGASFFRAFVDVLAPGETFPSVRLVRLGSEPLHTRDLEFVRRHFLPHCLLVNGLASNEAMTIRFFCIDYRTDVPEPMVPVGYPVEDKAVLLLDETGREVPVGEVGEIVVKSRYLSPGYWRQADLTEAVFRPAETPGGPRLYYTGDIGRMSPDGCLLWIGRKNDRVKIRGHAVDLLEVAMALRTVGNVKDSVVIAHQNRASDAYLVGYVVPDTFPGPTNAALRQALGEILPDFMIPTTFVVLAALPRTTSGKTDRQVLPAPGRPYHDPNRSPTSPRTPMETAIASILADVMAQESIDVHDHFYDLGGDSLQAMRLMARIGKTFDIDVDLQSLLDAPTVAELAKTVEDRLRARMGRNDGGRRPEGPNARSSALQPMQLGDGQRPVLFVPGGIGAEWEFFVYTRLARHVGPEYPFYVLKPRSAEGEEPAQASVEDMASDYLREIRAQQPDGPYIVIGDCVGGIVAYEIAQQLRDQGQRIGALILMDTLRPDRSPKLPRRSVASYIKGWIYHRGRLRELKGREKLEYLRHRCSRFLVDLLSLFGREPVQRSYSRTIHRYRPRPYDGKITLILSEELYQRGPTLGWDEVVRGGIDVHQVPGDHHSCIRADVQFMAKTIRECLEKSG